MYRFIILFLAFGVQAHQMSPTYPEWTPSYMEDIYKTRVRIFNKREDVKYFQIGVFDKDFKPLPFVTQYHLRGVLFNSYATFDIYINKDVMKDATYVCSESMLTDVVSSGVVSKICSKFKS